MVAVMTDHTISVQDAAQLSSEEISTLIRTGWRLTPATFAHKITGGQWIPAAHLLYISTQIALAVARGDQFIIVTMPPRHGKSELLSVHTPTWFLENYPKRNVILTSYGAELATDFSIRVRDTFTNEELQAVLQTRLNENKQKVDRFLTTEGGGMAAVGIGGPITGRGAHLLNVDDYIKNAEDSLSATKREAAWNWFLSTAYTRLEPGGVVVVLATRWNVDDLIGRMLAWTDGPKITLINLPAIAEENDPLGRQPGEALWPERYPLEKLRVIKGALGSYWFEAMYQQRPRASMGGVDYGACIKYCTWDQMPHPNNLKSIRAWDLASTEDGGDYTVGPKMWLDESTKKVYITDMRRGQWSPNNVEIQVKAAAEADGQQVLIWMEQEPGSAGKTVIDHYKTEVLKAYVVKGDRPTGPIEVRASPFLAAIEKGDVYIVRAPWNQAFIDELNAFPNGAHDDQISACALAYNKLCKAKLGGVIWGESGQKRYDGPIYVRENRIHKPMGVTW